MKRTIQLKKILGQDKAIRFLRALLSKKDLYGALLFTGISGIGKKSTALAFAAACNCSFSFKNTNLSLINNCGSCRSCKMTETNNHPDLLYKNYCEANSDIITVSNIKEIIQKLSLKPLESENKILILPASQKMNIESSNTFLKFLEEPTRKTIIILIANNKHSLLPTIISRCKEVKFSPLKKDIIKKLIIRHSPKKKVNSKMILDLSFGSYGQYLQLKRIGWEKKRNWLIAIFENFLIKHKRKEELIEDSLILSELLSEKKTVNEYLNLISFWLKDIIVNKMNPNKILNKDLSKMISEHSNYITYDHALKILNIIQETQFKNHLNVNLKLSILSMLIKIIKVKKK